MIVWVSVHAAERFVERVRPGLERREASVELARLVRLFGRRVEWPAWAHASSEGGRFCVELSDGVVVVVDPPGVRGSLPCVVTVKVRGGSGPGHVHRGQARRARRRGRRLARDIRVSRGVGLAPGFEEGL